MSFYKQDPNNNKKQIPNVVGTGTARYSHATCPAEQTIVKRPSYVTVNVTAPITGGGTLTNDITIGLDINGTTDNGLLSWDNGNAEIDVESLITKNGDLLRPLLVNELALMVLFLLIQLMENGYMVNV